MNNELRAVGGVPGDTCLDDAARAKADATADMALEGEGEDDDERLDIGIGFIGSFAIENRQTGEREHGVLKCQASNVPEAVGIFYLDLEDRYPPEESWWPPSIGVDPEPFVILRDCQSFLINPQAEPCKHCGDPEGSCGDPDNCDNMQATPE